MTKPILLNEAMKVCMADIMYSAKKVKDALEKKIEIKNKVNEVHCIVTNKHCNDANKK